MSDYREECIRRKDVQIGLVEPRPVGGKKKAGAKPYLMESYYFNRWGWSGRYADLKTATQAFDNHARKHPRHGLRLIFEGNVIRETVGSQTGDQRLTTGD